MDLREEKKGGIFLHVVQTTSGLGPSRADVRIHSISFKFHFSSQCGVVFWQSDNDIVGDICLSSRGARLLLLLLLLFLFLLFVFFFHLPIKRIWSMDRSACLRRDVFRDDFNFLRSSPLWKLASTTGWYLDSILHMSKYCTDPRRGRLESHMFPRGVHGTWELIEIWHSNVVGPSKSFLNGNIYIFFGSTAPVSWGWSPKRARHQWAVCWVPIHYRLRHRGFARISPVNSRFIQSYPKLDLFMAAYWTFS